MGSLSERIDYEARAEERLTTRRERGCCHGGAGVCGRVDVEAISNLEDGTDELCLTRLIQEAAFPKPQLAV
jgi:hypothetical protein